MNGGREINVYCRILIYLMLHNSYSIFPSLKSQNTTKYDSNIILQLWQAPRIFYFVCFFLSWKLSRCFIFNKLGCHSTQRKYLLASKRGNPTIFKRLLYLTSGFFDTVRNETKKRYTKLFDTKRGCNLQFLINVLQIHNH